MLVAVSTELEAQTRRDVEAAARTYLINIHDVRPPLQGRRSRSGRCGGRRTKVWRKAHDAIMERNEFQLST